MLGTYVAVGLVPGGDATDSGSGLAMETAEASGNEDFAQLEIMPANTIMTSEPFNRRFTAGSGRLGCWSCSRSEKTLYR
jgi:hypothetical protein